MKEKQYKFEPMVDQLVMHYASDGYLLHKVGQALAVQVDQPGLPARASSCLHLT